MGKPAVIKSNSGKLGVLLPGMGAVATTFIAGCLLARKGLAQPVGSLTQMGTLALGSGRADAASVKIADYVPLASLHDVVFGGWDLFDCNAYEAALQADVLTKEHLALVRDEMEAIRPMPAVFFPEYVKRLRGENIKHAVSKRVLAEAVREDIRTFKATHGLSRAVAVWCGSTEVHHEPSSAHASLRAFETALDQSDASISPSMIYAYACLKEGVPYANGAPNLTNEIPALVELAQECGVPMAGKDFKTGQTLMKTVLAPGLKSRMLGIRGWFSTNILGNRDGEVLDDPDSFKSKEVSKLGVLESILQPEEYPHLYGNMYHKVRIEYYPPRGDQKEGWDNIDIFGWLGYPMQIKVDFLCRDSILAAPIVLDLALFLDLAHRAGERGVQEWLSFYFKAPISADNRVLENDVFIQLTHMKNALRGMRGDALVNDLGHA
jgi:myo-inositol-1-phosphate synthase